MPSYSTTAKRKLNSVAGAELPVIALEITHPMLASPIRVVNDNAELIHQGNTFVALQFRVSLPEDLEEVLPRATLAVDNVGKELVSWIEASNGGEGAQVRMLQIMRSDPDVVEWEITLDLTNMRITTPEVTGELGFENLLDRPAVALTYRSDTQPGLF